MIDATYQGLNTLHQDLNPRHCDWSPDTFHSCTVSVNLYSFINRHAQRMTDPQQQVKVNQHFLFSKVKLPGDVITPPQFTLTHFCLKLCTADICRPSKSNLVYICPSGTGFFVRYLKRRMLCILKHTYTHTHTYIYTQTSDCSQLYRLGTCYRQILNEYTHAHTQICQPLLSFLRALLLGLSPFSFPCSLEQTDHMSKPSPIHPGPIDIIWSDM